MISFQNVNLAHGKRYDCKHWQVIVIIYFKLVIAHTFFFFVTVRLNADVIVT